MAGVLAAEHGARLGHHLLDVAVTHPRPDRLAAGFADDLGHGSAADQVVDHLRAGKAAQHAAGHDGGGGGARHRLGPVVDEEHAVGVTVEGHPDVGPLGQHPFAESGQVLGLDGVGRMVGEGAVELEVEGDDVDRERPVDGGGHQSAHAVGGVHHDLHGAEAPDVDEPPGVGRVGVEHLLRADGAAAVGPGRALLDQDPDLGQAGIDPYRGGPGAARLGAVVVLGVVAGREHHSGALEGARGEVEEVGGGQPEVDDVDAFARHSLGESGGQGGRRRPAIAAEDDLRRVEEAGAGRPQAAGDFVVDLRWVQPADVVRLEDSVEGIERHRSGSHPAAGPATNRFHGGRGLSRRHPPVPMDFIDPCR